MEFKWIFENFKLYYFYLYYFRKKIFLKKILIFDILSSDRISFKICVWFNILNKNFKFKNFSKSNNGKLLVLYYSNFKKFFSGLLVRFWKTAKSCKRTKNQLGSRGKMSRLITHKNFKNVQAKLKIKKKN